MRYFIKELQNYTGHLSSLLSQIEGEERIIQNILAERRKWKKLERKDDEEYYRNDVNYHCACIDSNARIFRNYIKNIREELVLIEEDLEDYLDYPDFDEILAKGRQS